MTAAADRFVDLACLTYRDDESRERRVEASALLAATPEIVDASVHAAAAAGDVDALRRHLDRDARCIDVLDCLSRHGGAARPRSNGQLDLGRCHCRSRTLG